MSKILVHPHFEGTFGSVDEFVRHAEGRECEVTAITLSGLEDVARLPLVDGYEHAGLTYRPCLEPEDDNVKIFHFVTDGEDSVEMDWSPYSTPSVWDFHAWVDLGRPGRVGAGPLSRRDLETMKAKKEA